MKRFLVTILAFLYLGVSSGVAMEIHYCMGKHVGAELFGAEEDQCGKCGMKGKKSGCCNDEQKFFKLDDLHKNVSNSLSFSAPEAIITQNYGWLPVEISSSVELASVNNHSPPLYDKPDRCVMLCTFRI